MPHSRGFFYFSPRILNLFTFVLPISTKSGEFPRWGPCFRHRHLLLFLAPLVLPPHLLLLLGAEVVLDIERLPDVLGCLPLDHVGHRLAGDVQKALDVQVVGRQDQLEESALVDQEEFLVPVRDVVCPLDSVLVLLGRRGIVLVLGGPLGDLLEDVGRHVGQRHRLLDILDLFDAEVLEFG